MRKICFITGTRADYGIMAPIMRKIDDSNEAVLQTIVTNMHLSPDFGLTVNEIIEDGFNVNYKVNSLVCGDSPSDTVKSMGLTMQGMADALEELKPDIVVILGDRYEMIAAASAATIFRIPIAHIHGGEITEGAYDDAIRHAITKLASIHFAATKEYADRIIQMGENPDFVFHAGAPGVDNIRNEKIMPIEKLEKSLDFSLGEKFVLVAIHPATAFPGEEKKMTENLLKVLDNVINQDYKVLFTLPNSDTGGGTMTRLIMDWAEKKPSTVKTVASLGRKRFYSALKHSEAIIGNSSAALIEAPCFTTPTVDIQPRQNGRAKGESVISCQHHLESLSEAVNKALSPEFKNHISSISAEELNPYEKSGSVNFIANKLIHVELPSIKKFFDIKF